MAALIDSRYNQNLHQGQNIFYNSMHKMSISTRRIWDSKEKELLRQICKVQVEESSWQKIAEMFNQKSQSFRTAWQCRQRWVSYERPDLEKHFQWTSDLEEKLLKMRAKGYSLSHISQDEAFYRLSIQCLKNRYSSIMRSVVRIIQKLVHQEIGSRKAHKRISPKVLTLLTNSAEIEKIDPSFDFNLLVNKEWIYMQLRLLKGAKKRISIARDSNKSRQAIQQIYQSIMTLNQKYQQKIKPKPHEFPTQQKMIEFNTCELQSSLNPPKNDQKQIPTIYRSKTRFSLDQLSDRSGQNLDDEIDSDLFVNVEAGFGHFQNDNYSIENYIQDDYFQDDDMEVLMSPQPMTPERPKMDKECILRTAQSFRQIRPFFDNQESNQESQNLRKVFSREPHSLEFRRCKSSEVWDDH